MSVKKSTYQQMGKVMTGEKGPYIVLGNNNPNGDAKWNYDVEITIKNKEGKVVHKQVNGFVSLFDPRKNGRTVPEKIKFELSVSRELAD